MTSIAASVLVTASFMRYPAAYIDIGVLSCHASLERQSVMLRALLLPVPEAANSTSRLASSGLPPWRARELLSTPCPRISGYCSESDSLSTLTG